MSIYEVFLLSPHFSYFSFAHILETAAEKGATESERRKEGHEMEKIIIISIIPNGFSFLYLSISRTVAAKNQFSRILLLSKPFVAVC